MVYALGTKSEVGYIVKTDMLDGKPAGILTIDQEPDGGVAYKGFASGRRCIVENFPTKMRWHGPEGQPLPDFNQSVLLNLSDRAMNFVEDIEPGVHQFVPVDYFDKNDEFLETRFFWVICNRIDSVNRECTTFVLRRGLVWRTADTLVRRGEGADVPPHIDPSEPSKLVYDSTSIGASHVWRDKHLDGGIVLVSDKFAEGLNQSGLTGVHLSGPLETV